MRFSDEAVAIISFSVRRRRSLLPWKRLNPCRVRRQHHWFQHPSWKVKPSSKTFLRIILLWSLIPLCFFLNGKRGEINDMSGGGDLRGWGFSGIDLLLLNWPTFFYLEMVKNLHKIKRWLSHYAKEESHLTKLTMTKKEMKIKTKHTSQIQPSMRWNVNQEYLLSG